ncbi:MAG: sulfatase-like hydrolase/transferase [Prevotella sp.]|jgi:phosphoglycerol transferase MdoB-like AlkP superfamily enzyme|nr:sulfatase-like hydrolase/transferase [Prevotella sp.]
MTKFIKGIYYVLTVHIIALLFMTIQRIVLLFTNWLHIEVIEESKIGLIISALLRGLWFDNVIACYCSILPLIILAVLGLFNKLNKAVLYTINLFYIIIYTIIFAIGTANIPYFTYFFKHINVSIFNWKEEGNTNAKMILQESSYYVYFVLFIVIIALFAYLIFKLSRVILAKGQKETKGKMFLYYIPLCLFLIASCIFGIRGRFGYNPIKTSQAYFCTNSFLNQLGINPSFYFMRDMIESSKSYHNVDNFMSDKDAISFVQKTLNIDTTLAFSPKSPISRNIIASGDAKNMNVIIILMESMSSDLLKIEENGNEITPFLNQLIKKSYYFDHFYSAGTHTNHGILATLYGLPALFDRNMMKDVNIPLCQGLPNILQEQGYRTMFFMTHEAQYDNMKAFLTENGIEEIYSEEDYPNDKIKNGFGVADDFLFEYALGKINEKAQDTKPFLSTILTISNHPPYIVPPKFKKTSKDTQYQIVAFADNAIQEFFSKASKQDWFQNTIFVLLGDHGKIVGTQIFDMPLSLNHVPLIIYSPNFENPLQVKDLGGQVDVFPTVMGLLNRSYINNTFGIDLFKDKRPYAFFSSDNALGCINSDYFYSYNFKEQVKGLYVYKEEQAKNFIDKFNAKADSMQNYSIAMFQTANYMLQHKLNRVNKTQD